MKDYEGLLDHKLSYTTICITGSYCRTIWITSYIW